VRVDRRYTYVFSFASPCADTRTARGSAHRMNIILDYALFWRAAKKASRKHRVRVDHTRTHVSHLSRLVWTACAACGSAHCMVLFWIMLRHGAKKDAASTARVSIVMNSAK